MKVIIVNESCLSIDIVFRLVSEVITAGKVNKGLKYAAITTFVEDINGRFKVVSVHTEANEHSDRFVVYDMITKPSKKRKPLEGFDVKEVEELDAETDEG